MSLKCFDYNFVFFAGTLRPLRPFFSRRKERKKG